MKYPKPIYIEWADAVANAGWASAEEAVEWGKESNWNVRSIGWLLNETDEYILNAIRKNRKYYREA